jgi:hypothetical protein
MGLPGGCQLSGSLDQTPRWRLYTSVRGSTLRSITHKEKREQDWAEKEHEPKCPPKEALANPIVSPGTRVHLWRCPKVRQGKGPLVPHLLGYRKPLERAAPSEGISWREMQL